MASQPWQFKCLVVREIIVADNRGVQIAFVTPERPHEKPTVELPERTGYRQDQIECMGCNDTRPSGSRKTTDNAEKGSSPVGIQSAEWFVKQIDTCRLADCQYNVEATAYPG